MKLITKIVIVYLKGAIERAKRLFCQSLFTLEAGGYNHSSGLLLRFFVRLMAIGVAQEAKVHLCCTPAA